MTSMAHPAAPSSPSGRPHLEVHVAHANDQLGRPVATLQLAETIIGLYKTELVRRHGPWKGLDEVEYATLEWVDWFNHRRLLEPIGHVPPAEFETCQPTTVA
jgi:putative transposase